MTAPAAELQKAVFAALAGDAAIVAALGGGKIYDHVPAGTAFPYVTFGRTSVYDWSTATESGTEQLFTLHVWSKARGRAEALAIIERIGALLHDQPLALDGHALVNLRQEFSEVRQDEDHDVYHGLVRFRAVTETA
ncbi:MAG: DUF3168 domain-containing protein [Rhizobiaceae bacterium]|nr:MAG: DUF3168 domain-containing protein [Rhizobiaceae bacterium]CAG0994369.1 hypothetical protein RHIZO_02428 [Rhizobiaceae bacterium]